jgi:hypothetical protein
VLQDVDDLWVEMAVRRDEVTSVNVFFARPRCPKSAGFSQNDGHWSNIPWALDWIKHDIYPARRNESVAKGIPPGSLEVCRLGQLFKSI